MKIQRKLLIGFVITAFIFSGLLVYSAQKTEKLKPNSNHYKDVVNVEDIMEDTNLSKSETDPTSQTQDKSQGAQASDTENINLIPENTPAEDTSTKDTPVKDAPAKDTSTKNISAKTAPKKDTPADATPKKNTPAETSSPDMPTKETQKTDHGQTTDNPPPNTEVLNNPVDSSKETITYEEFKEIIRTQNGRQKGPQENLSADSNTSPPIHTAPETTAPKASNNTSYANQVLTILNGERANAGLPPLTMNQGASNAALVRAKEIVSTFSHTRPSGQDPFTALTEAGVSYRAAGENIAWGQSSPTEVMNGWMNSSGHRANILNSSFTQVGIACFEDPNSQYGYYWVQLFIG